MSSASTVSTASTVVPDRSHAADFYEPIYRRAEGDPARLPWSPHGGAHPALVRWLDVVAPQLVRCGARVAVPGCGLGEDARAVAARGYDVVGFDVCEAAIAGAAERDRDGRVHWIVANIFDPPARWRHRFDLVVEVNTLQALVPDERVPMLRSLGELVAPHGHLLAVGHAAAPGAPAPPLGPDDGPPWRFDEPTLLEVAANAGLVPDGPIHWFESAPEARTVTDPAAPDHRFRGLFRHA